ncbi:hypothetical protein NVP1167O_39 [Vibrio phage 1.167.O._10N.261.51.F2]|nr:hypothetical protein NVP1167O_39 [Vibrio phage 1.167.O._10N.261.51.F2]
MKICTLCGKEKPVTEFYSNNTLTDGVANQCKRCVKLRSKNRFESKKHTKDFVISKMYLAQKGRSKIRGHDMPSYSLQEFSDWCNSNGIDEIMNEWRDSGYKKNMSPSVDRLDNGIGYTFENIQLVTWSINFERSVLSSKSEGKCKPVIRINTNGESYTEYVSASAAVRDVGYKICRNLKTGRPCRNGFYWKYK